MVETSLRFIDVVFNVNKSQCQAQILTLKLTFYIQVTELIIIILSIITQVIIAILALSLAKNGVIFRYNHLRRGDYSGRTNFQNGRLALCQCI